MKPFQKLLVPIDFSARSHNALRVAADVSRRYEAKGTTVLTGHLEERLPVRTLHEQRADGAVT